jgi:GNAT superfamily N-acetyltransferase
MDIAINPVTSETRDTAVALLTRFFAEEGFTTPPVRIAANFDRMLADASYLCAVAVDVGAPIAVITVSTVLYVEWGRLGEIGDLYVRPEHRRRGVARQLVEYAKAWCREKSCSAVSVTITPIGEQRHRLSRFYAGIGFEPSGRSSASVAL